MTPEIAARETAAMHRHWGASYVPTAGTKPKGPWGRTRAKVARLHGQGFSAKEISEKLGINLTTIYKHRVNLGITRPQKKRRDYTTPRTRADRSRILEALNGVTRTCEGLASFLDLSPGVVAGHLAKLHSEGVIEIRRERQDWPSLEERQPRVWGKVET